jgi:hypothetical protein
MGIMNKIKGISIRQPWVDMVIQGAKTMELRSFQPSNGWPQYLALHAPQRIEFPEAYFFGYDEPWKLPTGKLLGIAKLAEVILINEKNQLAFIESHRQFYPLEMELFGLRLEEVRLLSKPVSYRGRLTLFDLDESTNDLFLREFF